MYGTIALGAAIVAFLAQQVKASPHVKDAVIDAGFATDALLANHVKRTEVRGENITMRLSNGEMVEISDANLAENLNAMYKRIVGERGFKNKPGEALSRVRRAQRLFARTCVQTCGPEGSCTSNTEPNGNQCGCFYQCGSEGEECFEDCL